MSPKQSFEARTSAGGIAALRLLIGKSISQIFAPAVDVDDRIVSAPSLSIPLDSGMWVVLESQWLETRLGHIDYWRISAHISGAPKDITLQDTDGIGIALVFPVSTIHVGHPSAPVVNIEIRERQCSDPDSGESVAYDKAVVFHCGDGSQFVVAAHESIADLIDFSKDRSLIEEILATCLYRLSLE